MASPLKTLIFGFSSLALIGTARSVNLINPAQFMSCGNGVTVTFNGDTKTLGPLPYPANSDQSETIKSNTITISMQIGDGANAGYTFEVAGEEPALCYSFAGCGEQATSIEVDAGVLGSGFACSMFLEDGCQQADQFDGVQTGEGAQLLGEFKSALCGINPF